MRQYRKRVDPNQADIVKALERAGCTVCKLDGMGGGVPDLLVGYGGKHNILMEVKCRTQGRAAGHLSKFERAHGGLKETQWKWHGEWKGQVATVWTVEEALAVLAEVTQG